MPIIAGEKRKHQTVTIHGGTVTAQGGTYSGGTVMIAGGVVFARGISAMVRSQVFNAKKVALVKKLYKPL